MYNFVDVNEAPSNQTSLPSEAMTFGGKVFENELAGYRTLSVTGRELVGKRINTSSLDGMDGDMFQGSTYKARTITVNYQLIGENPADFRSKYNKLNFLLSREQVPISFEDEKQYEFIGTLENIDEVEEGTINVVSSFEIYCNSPYKNKVANVITGNGSVTIANEILFSVLPEEIKVTPTALINRIVIRNVTQGKVIAITNTFAANVPIFIYPKTQDIKRSNVSFPNFLEWTSDFENFFLNKGDQITVEPATTKIEIKIRERLL